MNSCFKCGITGEKTILMEAITDKKIVKVCQKCAKNEDIPIIRRPSFLRIEEPEKPKTVYERMRKAAGIKTEKDTIKQKEIKDANTSLRQIVDRNFKSGFRKAESHNDLIENFHWILMRARRLKKITIEQLAEKINESGEAIKMAEKGILPMNYQGLIQKLENFLRVNLTKKELRKKDLAVEVVPSEILGKPEEVYDKDNSRILTISDLKNLRNTHEEDILNNDNLPEFVKVKESDLEKLEQEKDLAPEEVDRVLDEEVEASKKVPRFSFFRKKEKKPEKEKETSEKYADNREDISQEEIDRILFGR
ncbi:MAG: hypothetical protein PVJ67_06900 [Candidatus Pacearchaeota archaeon]|jgi:ribosome-binding protein aMBF1 (putative translation factor)